MSEPVYSRSPGVVWRLGPDRVLVRRVGGQGEDAAAELMDAAALVWVALDQPATVQRVAARIEEVEPAGVASVNDPTRLRTGLGALLEGQWIRPKRD